METSNKRNGTRNLIIGFLVMVALCICVIVVGVGIGIPTGIAKQNQTVKATKVIEDVIANPKNVLSVVKINSGVPLRGCDPENCGSNYSEFKITNLSSVNIGIECSQTNACGSGDCEIEFGYGYDQHMDPGASTTIYCVEDANIKPPDVCFAFYPEYQYGDYLGKWCLDGATDEFEFREQ